MDYLDIESTENGFLAMEHNPEIMGAARRKWSFETAESLADFILTWGIKKTEEKMTKEPPKRP